jgi:lysophospholipase L1-like esterase
VRILCLGDSFTYGVGAERGKSYPKQLQDKLDKISKCKVQVINRGVPGLNSGYIREHFEENLMKYRPHAVLFMGGINNHWNATDAFTRGDAPGAGQRLHSVLSEFRVYKLVSYSLYRNRYRKDLEALKRNGGEDYAVERSIYKGNDHFADAHVVRENGRKRTIHFRIQSMDFDNPEASKRLVRDLEIMQGIAARHETDFIVMAYPNPMPVHEALRRFAEDYEVPLIDHETEFYTKIPMGRMPDYFFEEDFAWSHPNARGYEAMADTIIRELPRLCRAVKPCLPDGRR